MKKDEEKKPKEKVRHARYNHGRWIADCPKDNGARRVEPGQKFICDICYPGINAIAYAKRADGLYDRVPDFAARDAARLQAEQDGEVYDVVFPDEKEKIENICFNRKVCHMNWERGDTLQDLIDDNEKYGVETPEEAR